MYHCCCPGLGPKVGRQSRSVHLVAGRLAAGGVALQNDAEAFLLGDANPWLVEGAGRQLSLAHCLQPLRHGPDVDHLDLLLSEKSFQHFQGGEVGAVVDGHSYRGVGQLLWLHDVSVGACYDGELGHGRAQGDDLGGPLVALFTVDRPFHDTPLAKPELVHPPAVVEGLQGPVKDSLGPVHRVHMSRARRLDKLHVQPFLTKQAFFVCHQDGQRVNRVAHGEPDLLQFGVCRHGVSSSLFGSGSAGSGNRANCRC